MIALNILFVIIALILAFFLFFKLLKNAIKAVIFVLFLVLFVVSIIGFLIYLDIGKVKTSFENGQTALLLHEGTVTAGFVHSEDETKVLQKEEYQFFSEDELKNLDSSIKKQSYSGEDTLTIIVSSDYFIGKFVELSEGQNIVLNKETLDTIFTCTNLNKCISPLVDAAPSLEKNIISTFEDEQDFKNKLFFSTFMQETKDSKGKFIINGINKDKVTIYPSLITVKIIQIIPEKLIDKKIKKSNETSEKDE